MSSLESNKNTSNHTSNSNHTIHNSNHNNSKRPRAPLKILKQGSGAVKKKLWNRGDKRERTAATAAGDATTTTTRTTTSHDKETTINCNDNTNHSNNNNNNNNTTISQELSDSTGAVVHQVSQTHTHTNSTTTTTTKEQPQPILTGMLFHVWWISVAVAILVPTHQMYRDYHHHDKDATTTTSSLQDDDTVSTSSSLIVAVWMLVAYLAGNVFPLSRLLERWSSSSVYAKPKGRTSMSFRQQQQPQQQNSIMPPSSVYYTSTQPQVPSRRARLWHAARTFFTPGTGTFFPPKQHHQKSMGRPLYSASHTAWERENVSSSLTMPPDNNNNNDNNPSNNNNNSQYRLANFYSRQPGRPRPSWTDRLDPNAHSTRSSLSKNARLLDILKRNRQLWRRPSETTTTQAVLPEEDATNTDSSRPTTQQQEQQSPPPRTRNNLGTTGPTKPQSVHSFDDMQDHDYVIHPILKIRGMDIFLTDTPAFDISNNKWFAQNGLREVPSLIVNGVTQWGNIFIYFELPTWVHDLGPSLVAQDSDTQDAKALKRFLTESDQYRNERLKMIPSVVEGPMAVKVLAPPKKERVIHGAAVPLSWYMHDRTVDPTTGQVLHPVVLCAADCVSGKIIRNMAGLVKKYLQTMTIDLALVIGEPQDPTLRCPTEERQACLGLFRFDKIDVASCPEFPLVLDEQIEEGEDEEGLVDEGIRQSISNMIKNSQKVGGSVLSREELHDVALARRLSGISNQDFEELRREHEREELALSVVME